MHGFENSKGRNFSRMGQVTSSRYPRQRDESSREWRKWGLRRRHLERCLLLTGSQPGKTLGKLTKHRHRVFRRARGCRGWMQLQTAVSNQIINLLWAARCCLYPNQSCKMISLESVRGAGGEYDEQEADSEGDIHALTWKLWNSGFIWNHQMLFSNQAGI